VSTSLAWCQFVDVRRSLWLIENDEQHRHDIATTNSRNRHHSRIDYWNHGADQLPERPRPEQPLSSTAAGKL
jgi:hypothetical protein